MTEIRIELAADVLFDFDKADIRIDGHTDAKGNDSYNQKLSRYRAAAVQHRFAPTDRVPAMAASITFPSRPKMARAAPATARSRSVFPIACWWD